MTPDYKECLVRARCADALSYGATSRAQINQFRQIAKQWRQRAEKIASGNAS